MEPTSVHTPFTVFVGDMFKPVITEALLTEAYNKDGLENRFRLSINDFKQILINCQMPEHLTGDDLNRVIGDIATYSDSRGNVQHTAEAVVRSVKALFNHCLLEFLRNSTKSSNKNSPTDDASAQEARHPIFKDAKYPIKDEGVRQFYEMGMQTERLRALENTFPTRWNHPFNYTEMLQKAIELDKSINSSSGNKGKEEVLSPLKLAGYEKAIKSAPAVPAPKKEQSIDGCPEKISLPIQVLLNQQFHPDAIVCTNIGKTTTEIKFKNPAHATELIQKTADYPSLKNPSLKMGADNIVVFSLNTTMLAIKLHTFAKSTFPSA